MKKSLTIPLDYVIVRIIFCRTCGYSEKLITKFHNREIVGAFYNAFEEHLKTWEHHDMDLIVKRYQTNRDIPQDLIQIGV